MNDRPITPLPKSLPISGVILLILGLVAIPLIERVFTAEQLARNALLGGIPFIFIFAAIVIFYMSLAWFISNKLNYKVSGRVYRLIERVTIGGIVLGVIMMFQPWFFALFSWGFYLLLLATLAFIVWSHVAPADEEEEIAASQPELPAEI
jgi:uncharacterized protein YggT (Ycf19 family)